MYRYIKELPPPTVYFPIAQGSQIDERPAFYLAARASLTSPAALVPGIIDAIARIDKDLPLTFRTLSDQVKAQYTQERLLALVSVFFGAVALFLAALGLFGVTTFGVNLRRKEIGIRIALGADTASILGIVLGRVAMLVGAGVSIGLLVSLWAAPLLRSLLFDLGPRDPATLLAAICVLLLTSALAAVQPAVRARRIDPAELLRDN
jgi:ABC-type antimicrobial peptide transport system permease subunit